METIKDKVCVALSLDLKVDAGGQTQSFSCGSIRRETRWLRSSKDLRNVFNGPVHREWTEPCDSQEWAHGYQT